MGYFVHKILGIHICLYIILYQSQLSFIFLTIFLFSFLYFISIYYSRICFPCVSVTITFHLYPLAPLFSRNSTVPLDRTFWDVIFCEGAPKQRSHFFKCTSRDYQRIICCRAKVHLHMHIACTCTQSSIKLIENSISLQCLWATFLSHVMEDKIFNSSDSTPSSLQWE